MAIIQSDYLEVEREIREIVRLCEKAGSYFHNDLIIRCKADELSLHCENKAQRVLISLSESSLVSIDSKHFILENDCIVLVPDADTGWSPLQTDIAYNMLSIFNRTGKMEQTGNRLSFLSMNTGSELSKHITKGRITADDRRYPDKTKCIEVRNQAAIITFFQTRVLGHREGTDGNSLQVLMPIMDYANHHWLGSIYKSHNSEEAIALSIVNRQPIENSTECFAFYNPMDSFDTYLNYEPIRKLF
ncbi:hypothetical protein QUF90_24450 [Desulfococcaceae bacterium HSG9]|nr:hypothetical protein [Desulfococcaceae bacterium HSG9]